ncbi:MAG: diacylglycerol kinase family protein [Candidatus Peribacteraceae bacterium]|nr:diacylglycerol kinase family protein [Candidatus Peribacteraceae bacterium]
MRKFRTSLQCAIRGITFAWRGERNFRILSTIGIFVFFGATLLRFSIVELGFLTLAIALVLSAEMINTIVEELLDIIRPDYSEHVGRVKDLAAGAVLLLSLFSVVIGVLTVLHHLAASGNT